MYICNDDLSDDTNLQIELLMTRDVSVTGGPYSTNQSSVVRYETIVNYNILSL